MSENFLPNARTHPTSVLVYARDRTSLDAATAALAREVSDEPVRIDVVPRGASALPSTPVAPAFGPASDRRFEFEPSELIPDHALENLAVWVGGRSDHPSVWMREAEDLSWLPVPLQRCLAREGFGPAVTAVVVSRAELVVDELPLGAADVRHLLAVLARRRVTLLVGLLVRPTPEFSVLFDHVVRVRTGPPTGSLARDLVVERTRLAPTLPPAVRVTRPRPRPGIVTGPRPNPGL